ncbi:MAG: hypothetical protein HN742_42120 [Lentisphaerae bacterium]|jgi:beta-galactosidase GanA|nr:hypothetical protein [Lentisphaerota bacterium]MBT5605902.1 hypothetical protein [Lentisphaerota bacterium]MBT7057981.1 hypothetical protein [Lentisphaerota bacterium]MBT7848536.1 hypothetical protein [Lentisphaerota bacterium]
MTFRTASGMVALLLATCAQAQVESPGELLKNPGFDTQSADGTLPAHWNTTTDRVLWRERVYMSQDYEIVSKAPTYVLATQDIQLKKGQTYTLTVNCRGENGAVIGALIVHGETKVHREMPLIWNAEPTADYEDHVRTFVAPNPKARLFLYNIAKTQGTICYNHVSLREGEPDVPVISQLSFRKIDRPLTPPPTTPHIPWATPLTGGPLKAFITLRNFRCLRQVVELQQRLDLDCDVIHTGASGNECSSETGRRAMKRLTDEFYEVYVVPSRVPAPLRKAIQERVEKGAGLVIIEGFARTRELLDAKALHSAPQDHPLRQGIPWESLPHNTLEDIETGVLGKGRVVRLSFPRERGRVWGLMPYGHKLTAYRTRQFEYWEYWEALFAKAFCWAAGRETRASLSLVSTAPRSAILQAQDSPPDATASVICRSAREIRFDGPMLRWEPTDHPIKNGRLKLTIPAAMPAGEVLIDTVIKDAQGGVSGWHSLATRLPQKVTIRELTPEQTVSNGDGAIELSAELSAPTICRVILETSLIDAFGRRVVQSVTEHSVGTTAQRIPILLSPPTPICVHHKAFVRALADGREQDSRWVTVLFPDVGREAVDADFVAMPWGPGMSHPVTAEAYRARTRELGLNGEFARTPYLTTEGGLLAAGYIGGMHMFRENRNTGTGIRSRCLSDPEQIAQHVRRAREAAGEQQPYGLFAVGITDEAFLSSRHDRNELCHGPHCQKRYRHWLRSKYGTLVALNQEWGRTYASWEEVVGARTEDVRGKLNVAPFVDFRTFMTDVWVDACKTVTDAYHDVAPNVPIGHTNTFGPGPFNGNDYWKLCTQTGFAWGQEYSEAIKATGHKAIFDLWRSFADTPEAQGSRTMASRPDRPFFNHGWIGYQHSVAAARYEPWWLALHGARGVSYFATNASDASRGVSWALVYPTLSLTPYSVAVRDALRDLRNGCGKLLMEYTRHEPQIALLWSHASMLTAWCESTETNPVPNESDGTDSYGSYFRSVLHFRQHINELQLDYDYVAPDQILAGNRLSQYAMTILPFTSALSPDVVAQLVAYVKSGGVVVADMRACRTNANGSPDADSAMLQQLFGLTRTSNTAVYGASKAQVTEAAAGLGPAQMEMSVFGQEQLVEAGATAIGHHANGGPAVFVRPLGKGLAVYLNFILPKYDAGMRQLLGQLCERAGIERRVMAKSADDETMPPRCYELNSFSRSNITVHGFIRDHRRCTDSSPARLHFQNARHTYDVRAGEYLGMTQHMDTALPPGETLLISRLPYRVKDVELSLPVQAPAGQALALAASVAGDGAPTPVGDHVLHLDVIPPNGQAAPHYAANVLAEGGKLNHRIPLALNDPPGVWKVNITDVLTGTRTSATFRLTPVE